MGSKNGTEMWYLVLEWPDINEGILLFIFSHFMVFSGCVTTIIVALRVLASTRKGDTITTRRVL
jgi:hypothetical protein